MSTLNFFRPLRALLAILPAIALSTPTHAELHSKSHDIVVLEPGDLPEQSQTQGNSLFLYQDGNGNTFLYIEQQQGARIAVFDVTDPAKVKFVSSAVLTVPGPFDFVRPLDGNAELIRFRDNKGVAILDLHHAKVPMFKMLNSVSDTGQTESIGETGLLLVNEPHEYVRAIPRDYQVIDLSVPSDPALITTIKQVKHKVTRGETGTMFLLGSDGLTVIRRIRVEEDYASEQNALRGN